MWSAMRFVQKSSDAKAFYQIFIYEMEHAPNEPDFSLSAWVQCVRYDKTIGLMVSSYPIFSRTPRQVFKSMPKKEIYLDDRNF